MREADARVAGGALHDGAAWLQRAASFRVLNDVEGRTVLDGASGIQELSLAQNLAARIAAQTVEADQRCIAHCASEAIANCHIPTLQPR